MGLYNICTIYICDGFDGNIQVDISWDMTGTIFFFLALSQNRGENGAPEPFSRGKTMFRDYRTAANRLPA